MQHFKYRHKLIKLLENEYGTWEHTYIQIFKRYFCSYTEMNEEESQFCDIFSIITTVFSTFLYYSTLQTIFKKRIFLLFQF